MTTKNERTVTTTKDQSTKIKIINRKEQQQVRTTIKDNNKKDQEQGRIATITRKEDNNKEIT